MKKRVVAIMMAVMMTAVMAACNATSGTAGTPEIIGSQTMDEGTETVPETTEEMVPETEQPIGEIEPAETQESVPETEKPVPESEESVPETEETNVESNDNTASKPETSPSPETDPKPETSPEPQTSSKSETGAYTYADLNKTMYAKSSVNVRNLPATSGTKLGSLKKNNEVTVTGQCNETGWYRIVYDDGEAFVSNKYLSDEKVAETNIAKNTNSSQTDFLTLDGYLNPNNPIVAAAYEKYGENIAICEDGTVLDAATWQVLGKIDGVPGSSSDETGSFDRAAAEGLKLSMLFHNQSLRLPLSPAGSPRLYCQAGRPGWWSVRLSWMPAQSFQLHKSFHCIYILHMHLIRKRCSDSLHGARERDTTAYGRSIRWRWFHLDIQYSHRNCRSHYGKNR